MDAGISKAFQKIMSKQGIKFNLNTKVINTEKKDGKILVNVEGAKDGKKSQVRILVCRFFEISLMICIECTTDCCGCCSCRYWKETTHRRTQSGEDWS